MQPGAKHAETATGKWALYESNPSWLKYVVGTFHRVDKDDWHEANLPSHVQAVAAQAGNAYKANRHKSEAEIVQALGSECPKVVKALREQWELAIQKRIITHPDDLLQAKTLDHELLSDLVK